MSKRTDPVTEHLTKVYFDLQAASSCVETESSTLEDGNIPAPAQEDVDDPLRTVRSGARRLVGKQRPLCSLYYIY